MLLELTGSNQPINYAPRSQATLVRNRIGSPEARHSGDRLQGAGIDLEDGLRELIDWRKAHIEQVEQRRAAKLRDLPRARERIRAMCGIAGIAASRRRARLGRLAEAR